MGPEERLPLRGTTTLNGSVKISASRAEKEGTCCQTDLQPLPVETASTLVAPLDFPEGGFRTKFRRNTCLIPSFADGAVSAETCDVETAQTLKCHRRFFRVDVGPRTGRPRSFSPHSRPTDRRLSPLRFSAEPGERPLSPGLDAARTRQTHVLAAPLLIAPSPATHVQAAFP